MCIYGIGLPFDHPIWQNLPPCHCGQGAIPFSSPKPYVQWRPGGFVMFEQPSKGKKRRGKRK